MGAQWQGGAVEIVFTPGYNSSGALCLGEDANAIAAFARALDAHCLRPAGRALRYSEGWESAPDLDAEIGRVTWDDIVLPTAIEKGLRQSVDDFVAQRPVMHSFGFAWKRGILLIGPPGTGKTMVCKAVAASLPELPFLYVRDLREDEKKEAIQSIFARARKLAPCILAMEDLDSLIHEENRTIFLNEMDGFSSNEGLLILASSNHPGKIDEALLKRPSRFDRIFHLGNACDRGETRILRAHSAPFEPERQTERRGGHRPALRADRPKNGRFHTRLLKGSVCRRCPEPRPSRRNFARWRVR